MKRFWVLSFCIVVAILLQGVISWILSSLSQNKRAKTVLKSYLIAKFCSYALYIFLLNCTGMQVNDSKSTLAQAMAWHCQGTSQY